jgi:hypothetical protein
MSNDDDILGAEVPIVRSGKRYSKQGKTTPTTKDTPSGSKASSQPKAKPKAKSKAKAPTKGVAKPKATGKVPRKTMKDAGVQVGPGRPTLYDPEKHPRLVRNLALVGFSENLIANSLGISGGTFNNWKNEHEEILNALREGREEADGAVAASLFQRALGYSHPDVDIKMYKGDIIETPIIKHYPPDTQAAIKWLENRQHAKWRQRTITEVTGPEGGPIEQIVGTTTDFAKLREKLKAQKGTK